ncbi:MAG: hypothetical protein Tsb0014_42310 [Pleurocapsa sp.]
MKKNLFFCLILIIGLFFRFYHIDQKVYWHDEVYTSIRTAGYNGQEIVARTFTGEIISPSELLKYSSINNNKSWQDALEKLIEHPEHPPLYYLLSRAWQQVFGSSILVTRSLSVVFSLLVLPVIYWLCWELFNSTKVGWWAMTIIAISPVQIVYAQEAREYSLLILTTALSVTALIGAVKRNNYLWWSFYSISLALDFYVSLITIYIAIAQGIYILLLEKFRFTKITYNFLIAGIVSVILFAPWLGIIRNNYHVLKSKTSWTNNEQTFVNLLSSWELHLSRIFIDFNSEIDSYLASRILLILLISLFICYRLVYLRNPSKTWLLLATTILIPTACLIVPDLIDGGQKSTMTRYFVPSILMIQVLVAYWLAEIKNLQDIKRIIAILIIIFSGILSCSIYSQSNTWWNKTAGSDNIKISAIINNFESPLLVSSDREINISSIISIVYLLQDNVQLLLFSPANIPLVDYHNFSNVLIWNIKEESRIEFQKQNNCELKLIEGNYYPHLWLMRSGNIN